MVELIKVTACKDPQRWYSDYVGMTFVRLKDFLSPPGTSEWMVRTVDGHSNFIQCCDGEVVESLPLVETLPSQNLNELSFHAKQFAAILTRTINTNYESLEEYRADLLKELINLEDDIDVLLDTLDKV